MTIFIGNLSFDAEQEDIIGVFSSYGEVKDCKIPLDRETGRKRGFAFVDMANQEDEQKAIDHLQDVECMGRNIRDPRFSEAHSTVCRRYRLSASGDESSPVDW